jgi:hypothetical protein
VPKLPSAIGANSPNYQYQRGGIASVRNPGAIAEASEAAAVMGARTGGKIADEFDRIAEANDRLAFSRAKSAFLRESIKAESAFDEDKDHGTWASRYGEQMGKLKETYGKTLSGPYRELFNDDADTVTLRGAEKLKDRSNVRLKDEGRAAASDAINQNLEMALEAKDEITRNEIMRATGETIQAARDSGFYTAQEAASLTVDVDKRFRADWKQRVGSSIDTELDKQRNAILTDPRKFASAEADLMGRIDSSGLGQADKDKLKDKARNGLGLSAVQAQILSDPEQAKSALQSGAWDKYLDADRKAAAMSAADQQIKINAALAKAEAAERREQFTSDLTIAVHRGEKGYLDIEEAARNGSITPGTRTQLTIFLDRDVERQQIASKMIARVQGAGEGGQPLDPKSPEDKKALNLHYGASLTNWKPDEVVPKSIDYAARYGIVPEQFRGVIRGNLRSGDADKALMASDTIRQLRNQNPQLLNDFADEDLRLGNLVGSLTDAGMPPQAALQYAQDSLKVDKTTRETRQADYNLQRGKSAEDRLQSDKRWLEGRLNSVWSSDPTIDPLMHAEFDSLAKAEFEKTGNLDASRQFALDNVNRVWGRTNVGGTERYMKWAPEKMYGVDTLSPKQNAAWMSEQLLADVGKGALADPNNPLTADRIVITPDPTRTRNGRPVYQVSIKDSSGVLNPVTDARGNPLPWVPDWNSSAEKARAEERAQKDLRDARRNRFRQFAPSVGGEMGMTDEEIDRAIENGPPYPADPNPRSSHMTLTPEQASKSAVAVMR